MPHFIRDCNNHRVLVLAVPRLLPAAPTHLALDLLLQGQLLLLVLVGPADLLFDARQDNLAALAPGEETHNSTGQGIGMAERNVKDSRFQLQRPKTLGGDRQGRHRDRNPM